MSDYAQQYKVRLIRNTRPHRVQGRAARTVKEYIRVGISPRVHFHLEAVARTFAFFNGDMVITPDHIKAVAEPVLAHRLVLREGMEFSVVKEELLQKVIEDTGDSSVEVEEVFARFRDIKHGIKARKKSTSIHYGEHKSGFRGRRLRHRRCRAVAPGPATQGHCVEHQPPDVPREAVQDRADGAKGASDAAGGRPVVLDAVRDLAGIEQGAVAPRSDRKHRTDPCQRSRSGRAAWRSRTRSSCSSSRSLGTPQVFYMAQQIFQKLELQRQFPARRQADFSVPFSSSASRLKMRHSIIVISDMVDMLNDPEGVDIKTAADAGLEARYDVLLFSTTLTSFRSGASWDISGSRIWRRASRP